MTPLPAPADLATFWRLDDQRYAATWDSGEGARLFGGRWNPPGVPVVYCSLDPAAAILELAVHKGFAALDTVPHVLTRAQLAIPWDRVHVVLPDHIPNALWLYPRSPSAGKQAFGQRLLANYDFVAIPSAVSRRSWNLIFDTVHAAGKFTMRRQEALDLDPRLNPPQPVPR